MKIIYKTSKCIKNVDAFIFGLKGFSTFENEIDLEDLENYFGSEIFLSLDKNMFNEDLKPLEEVLKKIDVFDIKGILFYDLAVIELAHKLNIKTPLIWNQNFLATNYKTVNFYENDGIKGVVLPPIITIDEMIEIKKNTNLEIIVPVFGYQMIALSKRHLVSNYFDFIEEENNKDINYMIERDDGYPITEIKEGSKIYSKDILNVIKYINKLKEVDIDYIILDDYLIENVVFEKVSKLYEKSVKYDLTDEELNSFQNEISKLIPNSSLHFFNKKTTYKVKMK